MPSGVYPRTEKHKIILAKAQVIAWQANTGSHRTLEQGATISAALTGRTLSEKHKMAIHTVMIGNQRALGHTCTHTQEAKDRIGAAQTRRVHTQEEIAKRSGALNGNWKGGTSFNYGSDWHKQRKLALERDNHTCQNCGLTQEEMGQEPDVHHKVPFRISQDNSLDNLVCLCQSCHGQIEALLED